MGKSWCLVCLTRNVVAAVLSMIMSILLHWCRILPARRYASAAGTSYGPVSVSVCHKSVFCQNG